MIKNVEVMKFAHFYFLKKKCWLIRHHMDRVDEEESLG